MELFPAHVERHDSDADSAGLLRVYLHQLQPLVVLVPPGQQLPTRSIVPCTHSEQTQLKGHIEIFCVLI